MKYDDEHRWSMLQEAGRDDYIDMLVAEHDRGEHDVPGEEAPDCPSCEDRAVEEQDAQVELHELQDEEHRK